MRVLLVISDLTLKIKVKQTQVIFRSGFFFHRINVVDGLHDPCTWWHVEHHI